MAAVAATVPQPAGVVVSAVAPTEAPATAQVSAFAAAGANGVDPLADSNPILPAYTALEWTVAAFARRTAAPAAAVAAAAAAEPTYRIGACTQQSTSCTYVLGPSGVPIPLPAYAETVMKYYILPSTTQPDTTAQLVFSPEGAYPVTGIKALPLTISAQQGQTILEYTIGTLQPGPQTGSLPITLFGYSQSAVIGSLLQRDLDTDMQLLPGLDREKLTFVTVGQEMSPNGGWFARFPGLNLPSMGEYFFGSTPENSYPTTNYTLQYDGFADSPRYPANFLSSLNAAMGILLVHINYGNNKYFATAYSSFDPIMAANGPGVACNQNSPSCTKLPTTSDTQNYYFIQTPHLPLLAPVRGIPLIGKPLAALIEPVLRVIVNLGYADPVHGFPNAVQPMANVPLPFGVFPEVNPAEVVQQLIAGAGQGVNDFVIALRELVAEGLSINPPTVQQVLGVAKEVITTLPARINAGASALYATLLATADFLNAGLVMLPAYNARIFTEGIQQAFSGQFIEGIVHAIARPIAADIGLVAVISVVQVAVWLEGIVAALTGCTAAAPQAGMCIVPGL